MSNTAIDLKEYAEQKDMINRYGRQDVIYVMLDKRIDDLKDDVKELKGEMKEMRGEIKELESKVEADIANVKEDIASVKADIRVLDSKVDSLASTTSTEFKRIDEKFDSLSRLIKWVVGIFVTIILGYIALVGADIASLFGRCERMSFLFHTPPAFRLFLKGRAS